MKKRFKKLFLFIVFCQMPSILATEIEQTSDKLSQEGSAACYRYIAKLYGFDTSKEKKYTEKELRQRQREKLEYVADGDYSKLQYIISSNQKHYQ